MAIPCGTTPPSIEPSDFTRRLSAVILPKSSLSKPTTLPSGITFPKTSPLKFIAVISCANTS